MPNRQKNARMEDIIPAAPALQTELAKEGIRRFAVDRMDFQSFSPLIFIMILALSYISYHKLKGVHLLMTCYVLAFSSCEFRVEPIPNNMEFDQKLSEYNLFVNMPRLEPATGVVQYELSTSLFTDYSEKQRLIKLPKKTRIVARGNGLPTFPDGTILAKTFHYPNSFNENDTMRKIVETRLLVKKDGQWNAATYQWEQLCAMHIYLKMARKRQLATK